MWYLCGMPRIHWGGGVTWAVEVEAQVALAIFSHW